MATSQKRLALAIIDFLSKSLSDGTISSEDTESIEIAKSCIADTFHVNPSDQAAVKDAIGDQSLLSIYGVYEKLKGKTSTAPMPGASSSKPTTNTPNPSGPTPTTPEAEEFKSQGNKAMQQKDYPKAIDLYTKAITLSPTNPIYLSNRAAAYSASHKHSEACADAELATSADPKYTKAWSRLGLARFVLGDAKGSMEAYQKGIDYEGNGGSEAMKKGYKTAKAKVEEEEKEGGDEEIERAASPREAGGAGAGGGGMPDLAGLASMLGGGGGGGGGGMPDLGALMNNPMFASMAQNMMSNPEALQGLMNNPRLREMAQNFGGGGQGGGMPDISALMSDPSLREAAMNMMGGGGRGAGRGAQQ
ncbi:Small glutamine-rich tetratricopeptide repeat-containing protein 2 [Xanthoria calcicola]